MRLQRYTFSLWPFLGGLLFWRSSAAPGVAYGPDIIGGDAEGDSVSLLQSTADRWPPLLDKVLPAIANLTLPVFANVTLPVIANATPAVNPVFEKVKAAVAGAAEQAKLAVAGAVPLLVSQVVPGFDPAKLDAVAAVAQAAAAVAQAAPVVIDQAKAAVAKVESAVVEAAPAVIDQAKSAVAQAVPIVTQAAPVVFDKAKSAVEQAAPVVAPVYANITRTWIGILDPDKTFIEEPERSPPWLSGRGSSRHFGWSPDMQGPFELDLSWKWQHPEGRFHTLGYGTAIDEDGNIYLSAADGMRKFTPQGHVVWEHKTLPAEVTTAAALKGKMIYNSNTHGYVFALSTETGEEVWSTKVSEFIGQDNGFVTIEDNIVVVASDAMVNDRNQVVRGLNATTGAQIWSFKPDVNVWNFMASFPGYDTVAFQDQTGKAYELGLSNGTLLWKDGGFPGSWTDGTATIGMNGLFYTVYNNADHGLTGQYYGPNHNGTLCARDVLTGEVRWAVTTPRPPNNAPAVGRVYGYPGLSVVQPMGQQGTPGGPTDIYAYDGDTGDLNWIFYGPKQPGAMQAGDVEGISERAASGVRPVCMPNPWSAPVIDASGTVFIGNQDGHFFALRDLNHDGIVEGPDEVSSYDTKAAFSGSAGPSLARNRVVVASCDSLYVFGG